MFDLSGKPDEDKDGLPDEFEVSGLVISTGKVIYTDPEIRDCDGDGLLDGEEVYIDPSKSKIVTKTDKRGSHTEYTTVVFGYRSDPNDIDTDGDGILDNFDPKPTNTVNNGIPINLTSGNNGTLSRLQHWLVKLGYLDMGDNPYGELYGPVTKTAVYIYQLNHGFDISKESNGIEVAIDEIDDLTFATIANDYANQFGNGEEDYNNYVLGISNKPYFNSIEIVKPILTSQQSELNIKIVKMSNKEIKDNNSKTLDLFFFDYSDFINKLLLENAVYPQFLSNQFGGSVSPEMIFYEKVKPNGDWDYKLKSQWEKTFKNIPYMTISYPFVLRGMFCSPEKLGNINYAYVGKFLKFSDEILLSAANFVSILYSGELEDDADVNAVKMGIKYFNEDNV